MELLKKENWWVWLLLTIFSGGSSSIMLAALLGLFNKDAWYAKWYYWLIGALLFMFPFSIMTVVFTIQMLCQASAKLDVPGKEIYLSPYIWIIAIIVPIIGWLAIILGIIYLEIYTLINLYHGNGEKYIN